MRLPNTTFPLALAASMALTCISGRVAAEETVVVAPSDGPVTTGPNRALLSSGIWTLGLSYVPAVIVGLESDLDADRKLLIPVAGPWLDYAERDCPNCKHETMNKVLLVTDGVLQGIGALQILGSLLFVETRPGTASNDRTTSAKSNFKISPTRFETGSYGLTARGNF